MVVEESEYKHITNVNHKRGAHKVWLELLSSSQMCVINFIELRVPLRSGQQ